MRLVLYPQRAARRTCIGYIEQWDGEGEKEDRQFVPLRHDWPDIVIVELKLNWFERLLWGREYANGYLCWLLYGVDPRVMSEGLSAARDKFFLRAESVCLGRRATYAVAHGSLTAVDAFWRTSFLTDRNGENSYHNNAVAYDTLSRDRKRTGTHALSRFLDESMTPFEQRSIKRRPMAWVDGTDVKRLPW